MNIHSYIINKSNDGKRWERNKKPRKGWRFTVTTGVRGEKTPPEMSICTRRERGFERNWILRRNHLLGSLWKGPCPTYRLQRQARRKEESSRFSHVKLAPLPVHHSPSVIPPSFSMALHLVKKATQGSIINLVGLSQRRVCRINAKSIRRPPVSAVSSFLFFFLFGWAI